jgi:hypothetical protein
MIIINLTQRSRDFSSVPLRLCVNFFTGIINEKEAQTA